MRSIALSLPLLLLSAPAAAQERDFCASRPGLGASACTMAPGQAMLEIGFAGWDHTADPVTSEDDLTFAETQLRIGLDQRTELQIGFGGIGHNRVRDRASGQVSQVTGTGDLSLGLRRGLAGPNGPVAVEAFVTLPTGSNGIGAGSWSAGVLVPATIALPQGFELELTPELDLNPDSAGGSHHLAWGGVVGLSHDLGSKLSIAGEFGAWRDEDPAGGATDARLALSLTWRPARDWQLDFQIDHGVSRAAPDRSLAVGLAHRF